MDKQLLAIVVDVALIMALWLLKRRAEDDPRKFWVYLLYGMKVGPRTDVAYMTKSQLLDSGVRLVTWGLAFVSVFLVISIVAGLLYPQGHPPNFFLFATFLIAIFAGMGFVGGFYLLVRGLFRRKSYVPPPLP